MACPILVVLGGPGPRRIVAISISCFVPLAALRLAVLLRSMAIEIETDAIRFHAGRRVSEIACAEVRGVALAGPNRNRRVDLIGETTMVSLPLAFFDEAAVESQLRRILPPSCFDPRAYDASARVRDERRRVLDEVASSPLRVGTPFFDFIVAMSTVGAIAALAAALYGESIAILAAFLMGGLAIFAASLAGVLEVDRELIRSRTMVARPRWSP